MTTTRLVRPANRSVVLLSELFPPDTGGSSVLFGNIYGRLAQADRADVTVIRNGAPGTRESSDGPVRLVDLPMVAGHWGVSSVRSLRRYGRIVARLSRECRRGPAVVHCGRALPEGFAAMCAARLTGTPYLCWTHGEELRYVAGSRELTFLLKHVHRRAAAILANSRNTVRELEALQVPASKVHLVYPGVDPERFAAAGRGAEVRSRFAGPGELLMLTVGRLQRRKGHDLAIKALAQLRHDLPALKYVIAGEGDERQRLEDLVASLGIGDRVRFVGAVTEAELPGFYAAADFFVHPNRIDGADFEGFGIVFLEAAAAGLATIGGNSGGVPEAVEPGVTGLLIGGDDAAELAAAIRTLAESGPLRRHMGEAGRERVRRSFTWERAAADVAAIHERLSNSSLDDGFTRAGRSGEVHAA